MKMDVTKSNYSLEEYSSKSDVIENSVIVGIQKKRKRRTTKTSTNKEYQHFGQSSQDISTSLIRKKKKDETVQGIPKTTNQFLSQNVNCMEGENRLKQIITMPDVEQIESIRETNTIASSVTSWPISLATSFPSSIHNNESNSYVTLSQPSYGDVCSQLAKLNEQIAVQMQHKNYTTDRELQLAIQVQNCENYIRQRFDAMEHQYTKIVNLLENVKLQLPEMCMNQLESHNILTKLPISTTDELALLNHALNSSRYLEHFASQLLTIVKINPNNIRKSIYYIMSKIFTLDLIMKYTWCGSISFNGTQGYLPFSSLDGILKTVNYMLSKYATFNEIKNELKLFMKRLPRNINA